MRPLFCTYIKLTLSSLNTRPFQIIIFFLFQSHLIQGLYRCKFFQKPPHKNKTKLVRLHCLKPLNVNNISSAAHAQVYYSPSAEACGSIFKGPNLFHHEASREPAPNPLGPPHLLLLLSDLSVYNPDRSRWERKKRREAIEHSI